MDFLHEMKFSREFFLQSCADIFFTLQTTGRPCLCYTYILKILLYDTVIILNTYTHTRACLICVVMF